MLGFEHALFLIPFFFIPVVIWVWLWRRPCSNLLDASVFLLA